MHKYFFYVRVKLSKTPSLSSCPTAIRFQEIGFKENRVVFSFLGHRSIWLWGSVLITKCRLHIEFAGEAVGRGVQRKI